ncbi:MAG: FAD-dependent oxidoreductase [Clostridia bacterium]|nr:FAD-dependent oxidoreductase [Clostridia bacterium]
MEKYDVIVIGAGVAGMTAALNCRRAEKSVLLLEKECVGGQIALSPKVENYPTKQQIAGSDLADEIFDQITEWGVEFDLDTVEAVSRTEDGFEVKCGYNTYQSKSVIVATGVHHRPIGVAREEELIGKGVSYCAICDGAFYQGEDVVVIGDANTALQYSNLLAGYCKSVHICTLFDKFFGDKTLVTSVLSKPNVRYTHNLALKEFVGDDELTGLVFEDTKTHDKVSVECKAVFICIGQIPHNDCVNGLVDLDKYGYIISDENCFTSCPGVFVAGDCRTKKVRQVVTAMADGGVAGFNCCQYLDTL